MNEWDVSGGPMGLVLSLPLFFLLSFSISVSDSSCVVVLGAKCEACNVVSRA